MPTAKQLANLKPPINQREEQREIRSKGGKKSGEVRRARKTLKEELLAILSSGNNQERMSLAILEKAFAGDTKAFELIRDTIGEKPTEKQEITGKLAFKDFLEEVEKNE